MFHSDGRDDDGMTGWSNSVESRKGARVAMLSVKTRSGSHQHRGGMDGPFVAARVVASSNRSDVLRVIVVNDIVGRLPGVDVSDLTSVRVYRSHWWQWVYAAPEVLVERPLRLRDTIQADVS